MNRALLLVLLLCGTATARTYETAPPVKTKIQPPTKEWTAKIERLAPARPTAVPKATRRILLFSLRTGYDHRVTPHVDEVVKVLSKKSGAFEVVQSNDIDMFSPERIMEFDAVILNNNCSKGRRRNLFLDVLDQRTKSKKPGTKYKDLTVEQRKERADELQRSLLDYVASGKGLVCVHGGITLLNNSPEFSDMIGGSFDFHPPLQRVTLDLVEPDHPMLAAFGGKGFVHVDEPYLFNGAYEKKNFRPLLVMDVGKLDEKARADSRVTGDVRYIAWIKKHGKGRVFYVGPSHQPESYETASMLRFYLDGIQYALGDLICDDTMKENKP
ncbi:MAG: ThuA domain-containing protein [Pirellulales bacterium]|nr:ThuA domain-containing protein [Pirellulales bacterium]